ncbi:MAG: hypothetical protein HY774_21570 [Acidobacteria bacterium]|nr:hypothetical protein [Acidobacteriota bacterium]
MTTLWSLQRPSGREYGPGIGPVGAPQSRLPTGYYPSPIRAEIVSFTAEEI